MDIDKHKMMANDAKFDTGASSTPPTTSTDPAAPRNNAKTDHERFCHMVGMPLDFETAKYPSIWNILWNKALAHRGLYTRVRKAYQWHTFQYWLVATLSNVLLWMQICFGAALTALGGTKSDKVSIAIVTLGALQTVFGGLITYFKSRNQPNRARQFRIGLKRVLDAIENYEALYREGTFDPPPYTPVSRVGLNSIGLDWLTGLEGVPFKGVEGIVLRLMDLYMDTVKEAENNYPDYWAKNTSDGDPVPWMVMKDVLKDIKDKTNVQGSGAVAAAGGGTGGSGTTSHPTTTS